MIDELTKHNFTNFKRFEGIECRDGRAGCFLSHVRCAFEAYHRETSEYILILEDDCLFNDIGRINAAINRSITELNGFDVFVITDVMSDVGNSMLHKPPKQNTWRTHFLLYRRVAVPSVIERFYHKWLMTGVLDAWGPTDTETVVFSTNDCIQDNSMMSDINHLWDSFILITDELHGDNAKEIIQHITGKQVSYSDIATYIVCGIVDHSLSVIINDKRINNIHLTLDRSITISDIIHRILIYAPQIRHINLWDAGTGKWTNIPIKVHT